MNISDRSRRSLYLLSMLVLIALVSIPQCPAQACPMIVRVMDVGQGDAILVQFPNGQNMLVDAGDSVHGPDVVSYLRSLEIKRIDILVATHPHADHIGGMPAVLGAFEVGKVWDSGYDCGEQRDFLKAIKNKNVSPETPKARYTEKVGDVGIEVLAPVEPISGTDNDPNNNCLVLRVTYDKVSFLLAGDMEAAERAKVFSFPKSTVLKVSHHGSSDGTDAKFLAAVSPRYAVISVDAKNKMECPHESTMAALREAKAIVYCTSTSGTVVFTTDGKDVTGVEPPRPADSATTAVTSPPPSPVAPTWYIGNVNSLVFHLPTCGSLPYPKNQVRLASREEAIAQGYHACPRCRP